RQRVLIDCVEVRAFLAIHFDVDEQLVHPPGDLRIFEALMGHHMAPMAGGIADRPQDRLVLGLGGGERRLAPWLPVNRIVLVLKEIGARFLVEAVTVHDNSRWDNSQWRHSSVAAAGSTR